MRTVGHFGGDLDAAVDGAGGQEQEIGLGFGQTGAVHAKEVSVFVDAWEQAVPLPFELDAEHVDDIAARQHFIERMGNLDAQFGDGLRNKGRGAAHDHLRPELGQAVDVAACHPAMGDVADQADREVVEPALELANGKYIEQALRGVFVGTVAGVDDAAVQVLGQEVRGAGRGMPDHHDVHAHGLDILGRVDECFAFAEAGAAGGEIESVCAEPASRQAEAGASARRGLEEQVDHDLAGEG